MSLFLCPICGEALEHGEHAYFCANRHSFDISKEGYIHLLPANKMNSKIPGDSREMAAARNKFLSKGYYKPLCDALCDAAEAALSDVPAPSVLDCGCGEGYYTAEIFRRLSSDGRPVAMAGVDISKPSLRYAARREHGVEFAVASVFHLPAASASLELALNIFSPLCLEEYRRILKKGGQYIYVVPAARHLWGLKSVLYETSYENDEHETPYDGFSYCGITKVRDSITLSSQEDINALFQMTPYYWKTPRDGAARLASLDTLSTEIAFDIHIFKKTED